MRMEFSHWNFENGIYLRVLYALVEVCKRFCWLNRLLNGGEDHSWGKRTVL